MGDIQFLKELQENVRKGQQYKYLYFWGHTQKVQDLIDKSCFSQWFPAKFEVKGVQYQNTEQYMMAQKAKLFADEKIFQKILQTENPEKIKVLGRQVKNYEDDVWNRYRYSIVLEGNLAKFSQNENLKQFLYSTHERVLVEASPVDKIWGIGLAANHEHVQNPLLWDGLNLLGFTLMDVRKQLF